MASTNKRGIGAVARAATGYLNLTVAGGAAVAAASMGSWTVALLGGVTYGALVVWDLARGGKGSSTSPSADAPKELRSPKTYSDPETRKAVQLVLSSKAEVERAKEQSSDDVQASLALAFASVDGLLERAASFAERAEDLSRYLATKDPRVVRADAESLRARARQAADAETRATYESALAARMEHLKSLDELVAARERLVASLLSIASSLEALPAKVVNIRALDADAVDKQSGDVNEELERVNGDMKSFEETLRTLAGVNE